MKHWKRWLSALLAAAMLLSCCGALADEVAAVQAQADALPGQLTLGDLEAMGAKAYTHDDRVTFVEGDCAKEPIQSMDGAALVVNSMVALLGGDGNTHFEPWRELTDTTGNHYYVFQQLYANTTVLGGAVKVVTDAEGGMLGLVGSVESKLPEVEEAEGITVQDAEALALDRMAQENKPQAELLEGRTEKVILPVTLQVDFTAEEIDESSRFVWAVYTTNPDNGSDKSGDLPYLAHYVTMGGEYLYSLPTIMPGDEVSTSGYNAAYVFENMEPVDYTGKVTLSDGTEREISISLMRDARTGTVYLGNLERRIVVADCYEFLYNDAHLQLESSEDNTGWDDTCLMSLYNYCRAWDYYNALGWVGGDGLGTPIVILKDYCNANHDSVDNAAYAGRFYGWQVFLSSASNDYAQCLDVLGHEFTHCVTGSVMTYNAYMNDYGAINEAMSDIQGNICEMMMDDTEDDTWLLGENSKAEAIRSMSDPQLYGQPAFSWDLHYLANVSAPTELNDRGGVHTNSSLLNNVAYRLCENGGMTLEEARAFWFAVDCAMVPGTDYAQLSELMPWVLKHQGMGKYLNALETALDATRMRSDAVPDTFDDDRALLTLTLPETEGFMDGNWQLMVFTVNVQELVDRVVAIVLGEGEYANAMNELFEALPQTPESAEEPEESQGNESLFDFIFNLIARGLDEEAQEEAKPEATPEPTSEEEAEANAEMAQRIKEWFNKYLADTFYLGSGSAGQDGRTVQLVCRPGSTIPLLYRLEIDSEMELHSCGLSIYTFGHWIDLSAMVKPLIEIGMQGDDVNWDELDLSWYTNLLGVEEGTAPKDTLEWVSFFLDKVGPLDTLLDRIFYTVKGAQSNEIPADGLGDLSIIDHDFITKFLGTANLLELMQMVEEEDQEQ